MIAEIVINMITALADPTAISFRLKVYSYMKFDGSQAEPFTAPDHQRICPFRTTCSTVGDWCPGSR